MLTLIEMLVLYLGAIAIGKRVTRMSKGIYLLLFLLAIIQTAIIMFDMFSRSLSGY
jgi:hypothetical protein